MKRQNVILLLLWLIPAAWMVWIFTLSAETAAESTETSSSFLAEIIRFVNPSFDGYSAERSMEILEQYSFLIRKTAHFTVYAALGFFVANALAYQNRVYGGLGRVKILSLSFLLGALYAASDELHQLFVPGRSGQLGDVLLDSAGVLLGGLCSLLLVWLIQRYDKRRSIG